MTSNAAYRRTAILVASLFLLTTLRAVVASALLDPVIGAPDYLTTVFPNRATVTSGVLFWLINDIGIVFIGVLMFPILRKQNETMALGYVSMRMFECAFMILGVIFAMLLIPLSQEFSKSGAADVNSFQAVGALLKQAVYWCLTPMQLLFLGLGGVLFTSLLYQTRLVPRFISVVGLIGYALLIPNAILAPYGILAPARGGPGSILAIPVAVFEILLKPIWLYVKGFNTAAISAGQAAGSGKMEIQPSRA
jgi:hypothetical protein